MTPFFSPGPSQHPAPSIFTGAVNSYNCRVAGEVSDGLALHSLTSAPYIQRVVKPGLEQGAERAGRDPRTIQISGGGFIATGPNKASIQAAQAEVRRRIAFYASTRSYFPVLECHGFLEVGQLLHQMSLRGEWAEMAEMVSDEMLDAFSVAGEYDEVAEKFVERYGGLLDEVNFSVYTSSTPEEGQIRKIIKRLQQPRRTDHPTHYCRHRLYLYHQGEYRRNSVISLVYFRRGGARPIARSGSSRLHSGFGAGGM